MLGVDVALMPVQVVALVVELGDEHVLLRQPQALVVRQLGRLSRPHVCEDQPSALGARVGALPYLPCELAPLRFARLVETVTVDVEQPPVVDATETAVLDPSVAQVGTPVRTAESEQPQASELVAEEREVLAHDTQRQRRPVLGQLLGQRHRLPVPPEQVACGRPRPCPRQQFVVFLRKHAPPP